MKDRSHMTIRLVSDNKAPVDAGKQFRAPKVSPYCPVCNGNLWINGNMGRADYGKNLQYKCRVCAICLANGKVTTW